jgi:tetratricopeptide (TPR) repeat protein
MKNKYILWGLLLLSLGACTEDDLSLSPTGQDLESNFYQNAEQINQALYGAYDPLGHVIWGANPFLWGSITSDDAVAAGGDLSDQSGMQVADRFNVLPDEGKDKNSQQFWESRWKMVYRSNLILNYAPADTKEGIIARAHANFIKGLAYFELARMYGPLPIIDEVPTPNSKYPRATMEQTWAACEGYFTSAIADLPARVGGIDPDGLATKGSAQAYLGKAYLYQGKYSDAITVLNAISTTEYSLETSFAEIFNPANRHGKESLFEINFSMSGESKWDSYVYGNASYTLIGPRTGEVTIANATFEWGWGYHMPTQKLMDAFEAAGDIERKNNTILTSDSINEVSPSTAWQSAAQPYYTGMWDCKHLRRKGFFNGATLVAQNIITMRLADVYLMLAEAYNKTSDDDNARLFLNKVRLRAKLADITTSGAALLADIKLERRLELALEGDRYFDLVRWGDAATVLTGEFYDNTFNYTTGRPGVTTNGLFPIPYAEIGKDANFGQNAGY